MNNKLVRDQDYWVWEPGMNEWMVMTYIGYDKLQDRYIFRSSQDDEFYMDVLGPDVEDEVKPYITFTTSIRYTAGPKFEDAKEIGLYTDITKVIEEAGEKGLTQNELNSILGKDDSSDLNIMLKDLKTVGVLVESNDRPSK